MKIKALQDTFLKRTVQQSSLLSDKEKVAVNKDQILEVTWVNDKDDVNHYQVALHSPLKGYFNWFIFKQHCQINGNKQLTEEDYIRAAASVGLSVAHIKAVTEVEAGINASGFLASGNPVILCEGHLFSYFTNGEYDSTYPQISHSKWDRSKYYGGQKEWDQRFMLMYRLDTNAAIRSTSFGLFQILGDNYRHCGYTSPFEYYQAVCESEYKQLECFLKFIGDRDLIKYLKSENWTEFSRRYNGPSFLKNDHHNKLKRAFEKYSKN